MRHAHDPAARALDLGPAQQQRENDQRHADDEHDQRRAAHGGVVERRNRTSRSSARRGHEKRRLPIDEMERRQIELFRDRRAGGERHHHADHHHKRRASQDRPRENQSAMGPRSALDIMIGSSPLGLKFARAAGRDPRRDEVAETVAARFEIDRKRRRPATAAPPAPTPAPNRAPRRQARSAPHRSKATSLPSVRAAAAAAPIT